MALTILSGWHRRHLGGPRREVTARVRLERRRLLDETPDPNSFIDGWAINVSRGGLRIVVESELELSASYYLRLDDGPRELVRVVWIRVEDDGQIVGLEYLERSIDSAEGDEPMDERLSGTFRTNS